MILKRMVAVVLIICISTSCAFAEDVESSSLFNSVGGWFNNALNDSGDLISQTWEDSSERMSGAWDSGSAWVSRAWEDSSAWASQAWIDSMDWVSHTWADSSAWLSTAWVDSAAWVGEAWNNSSEYAAKTWDDSSNWAMSTWQNFAEWVSVVTMGNPYSWIEGVVLDNGVLAYDRFTAVRTFLRSDPDIDNLRDFYDERFNDMSLLEEDKEIIWSILEKWSEENNMTIIQTARIALPFMERLLIEGGAAIGEDVVFSGPIVAQYLFTILEAMKLDSNEKVDAGLNALDTTIESLTRPVIIGDTDQNVFVTNDGCRIENFTYANGKYQIVMIASVKNEASSMPLMRGMSLEELTNQYFGKSDITDNASVSNVSVFPARAIHFNTEISDIQVSGETIGVWTTDRDYTFFIVTDKDWSISEVEAWLGSITFDNAASVSLEVDMESDGAFYGVNQVSQKYTINRIFTEEKFILTDKGHGWAAERGNNLIDNIKGVFLRYHSTITGDNNVKNGPDRVITYADKPTLRIQSKYYKDASQGIAACFKDGKFRYVDADNKPMAIEVPSDQYEAAVRYMENRIRNGQVEGIDTSDTARATEIVRKGNLTYQQAKHIAKAGTIESILYDSANGCVTAATSFGLSSAVEFAFSMWNGEGFNAAIKSSILQGLKTGGTSFIVSVLSSQLAKTGLNTAMIPASKVVVHALGPKVSAVIINAFRPAGSAIYGAAAMQSAAKLLRGNAIVNVVSFVVLSASDVSDIIQGKISWTQLAKNASTTAAGVAGGSLGYIGGAAIGTAIMPGAGTVVGLIIGAAAGWGASEGADAIADLLAEDDADEMIRIIETQFAEIAPEYFLTEDEVVQCIVNLQNILTADTLKEMYHYANRESFARQLIEMCIDPIVSKRTYIDLPTEDVYAEYVVDTLESIYDNLEKNPSDGQ